MASKCRKGSPVWMATFADLMSLLMALFVLLFAMSTIEVPKYQAVVESFNETLGNGSELTPEQKQFFESVKLSQEEDVQTVLEAVQQRDESTIENLQPFYESLIETYAEADQNKEIKIEYDSEKNVIQLVFPEQIAFDPGRAVLKPRFRELLRDLFDFKNESVSVKVFGHTDSRPIYGGRFKSNWELSSARASSVVEALIRNESILPTQGQAIGVADTQPISFGKTTSDYAKNRRVEILMEPANKSFSR